MGVCGGLGMQGLAAKFTASEFLAFAKAVESQEWVTPRQKKPFRFWVEPGGTRAVPSTGRERSISNSEIAHFCEIYSQSNSQKAKDYRQLFNQSYLRAIASRFDANYIEFTFPEEVTETANLREGAVKMVSVNAYERSPEARRRCIESHGSYCKICTFNFGEVYGDFAAGFIHVHHLSPISLQGGERAVDPVEDLCPVCPNCHAVIHMRGGCLSIQEVQALLRRRT